MDDKNRIQYELLEFLQKVGITQERNVSDFIKVKFADAKPIKRISNEEDKGVQFLQALSKREYIKYNVGELDNINGNYRSSTPPVDELPMWFDMISVNANITFGGLEYLNQHLLNENIINANSIISANSTKQTCALYLAALFTFITLGTTIANYCISKQSLKLSIQIAPQSKIIEQQSHQIHTLQIELSESMNQKLQKLEAKKTLQKKP